ncbi:MAG: hypothetical protein AABW61_00440 [Candidatus Aenigmatarchaeota archaeon]
MLDNILRRASSRNLPELHTLEQGATATLEELIEPERDIFEFMEEVKTNRWKSLKFHGAISALGIIGTAVLGYISYTNIQQNIADNITPYIQGISFYTSLGGLISLVGTLVHGNLVTVARGSRYLDATNQINHARELSEEGCIFANELGNKQLLPSQVEKSDFIGLYTKNPGSIDDYLEVVAVKKQLTPIIKIDITELRNYIGQPVIVSANVTSAPRNEDMKLHALAELRIRGFVGIFPMSGTARGYVDGDVYVEETPFRIGIESGYSIGASFNYLHTLETEYGLPVELRRYSQEFDTSGASQRNNLVHFLNEAKDSSQRLLFMGKVSPTGNFHVEAIARPENGEMYALAVYQPLSTLKLK